MKILIADDEDDCREPFVEILKRRGHTVLESATGEQTIWLIQKERPDLVYLDISLADAVTGMDVLKHCKPQYPEVEIVMVSAYEKEYKTEALRLGALAFCKKPITKLEYFLNPIEEVKKKKGMQ